MEPIAPRFVANRALRSLAVSLTCCLALVACSLPEPTPHSIPTLPAVLEITPAPTLDIDATATALVLRSRVTPTVSALYTVVGGDTLSDIALRFGTTVDELVAANGLTDPNTLQPGETLIIPSLLRTPSVVVVTPTP